MTNYAMKLKLFNSLDHDGAASKQAEIKNLEKEILKIQQQMEVVVLAHEQALENIKRVEMRVSALCVERDGLLKQSKRNGEQKERLAFLNLAIDTKKDILAKDSKRVQLIMAHLMRELPNVFARYARFEQRLATLQSQVQEHTQDDSVFIEMLPFKWNKHI